MMLLFSFVKVYELHENRKKRNVEEKQKKNGKAKATKN